MATQTAVNGQTADFVSETSTKKAQNELDFGRDKILKGFSQESSLGITC
ncbi:hypothetical protein HG263_04770 [Pseudoalteromonas sp. JBTF-M23]|uniref:Uncharacterized protein n=1 Tax=Pseudoalteromonas caenipelagi TaxID=2726988 RepID=A0A849VDN0_9GAMM|nr:hypothetical protein [Pseudoalteromonas caenipelagi]NOU49847.1 hypothetical protein [Pseudoalteromonas caenipelagi]